MDRENVRCEYYSSIKMNAILSLAAKWIELEGTTLSEISQTQKVKYHMVSVISGS